MEKRSLGPMTLAYPLPVFLVGSYDKDGKANIMNAAWGGICCSEPPCLTVSIRRQRWTFDAIMERKAFTVSIPDSRLAMQADYAGLVSGAKVDKFAAAGLTPVRAAYVDAPYVGECPVVIELALFKTLELGSHVQFVGEIKDVKVSGTCINKDGSLNTEKIDPILFDTGSKLYHRIGDSVGKAFSLGRKLL